MSLNKKYGDIFIPPEVCAKLRAANISLFNPANGVQLKRMHDEMMNDPETKRLIQQMADESLAAEPCSETVQ